MLSHAHVAPPAAVARAGAPVRRRRLGQLALVGALTVSGLLVPATPASAAAPPPAGGYFSTKPVGSPLPSGSTCAAAVRRSAWEPRPENTTANRTRVTVSLPPSVDYKSVYNQTFLPRIKGDFTGTTDEIIQWASCKWGISDEIVRAQAVNESTWRQAAEGDMTSTTSYCPADKRSTSPCPQSFGLLQVKARYNAGSYPAIRQSTAWHLDYALSKIRGCYEGWQNLGGGYTRGDLWGCLGAWYSGSWKDAGALRYISHVREWYSSKPWRAWPDRSTASTPTTADTTAPSRPSALHVTSKTSTSVALAWTRSTDATGVVRYEIRRGRADNTGWVVLGSVSGSTRTYVDRTARPATGYSYGIRAYDAARNESRPSNIVFTTTPR